MKRIINHLKDNSGFNEKIILIVIAFVVGAILMTLVLSSLTPNGNVAAWIKNSSSNALTGGHLFGSDDTSVEATRTPTQPTTPPAQPPTEADENTAGTTRTG